MPSKSRLLRSVLAALDRLPGLRGLQVESSAAAFSPAELLVAAPAPFASSSYARARLLRQMHATGLLSQDPPEAVGACVSRRRLPPDC